MPFRVLVVDDERPARAVAARFLADDVRFELAGEASDGAEAVAAVRRLAPDLLILDVRMPGRDGLQVLAELGTPRPYVIFATAHAEYAGPAFEVDAIDYLRKPFARERFRRALDKAARVLTPPRSAVVLRTPEGLVAVDEAEIVRISASGKHVVVVTRTGRYTVREALGALEARLSPTRFVRVHRSEIVNLSHVECLQGSSHGDGIIVLHDGTAVVLSRTCRHSFLGRFGKR